MQINDNVCSRFMQILIGKKNILSKTNAMGTF